MSVIVNGMDMSKDGVYWCEIGVADDIATITIHGEERKSFHLVLVPPHGRLIDADALPKYTGMALSAAEVARAVESAPTVIEAEE